MLSSCVQTAAHMHEGKLCADFAVRTVREILPELLLLAEASGVGVVHVTAVHAVNAVVISISVGVGVGPLCDIFTG